MNTSIQAWAATGRNQLLIVQRPGSTLPPGGIVISAAVPSAPIAAIPWLGNRTDDMSTPTGFAVAAGTPLSGGSFEAQVVGSQPTLDAITAVAQSVANPFNLVNHTGYVATAADQAALCLVRSLTVPNEVLAQAEYVSFTNASTQPAAAAGTYSTIGDALYAKGGTTGEMKPAGVILTGPFTPATQFKPNDPVLGTLAQEQLRYVGSSPTAGGAGTPGNNVGESTNLQGLADIVNDSRNFLGIAPAAKAAVLADIALNNGGVAYYDLNNVMIKGQFASDWITAQHAILFPVTTPVTPPVTPPATASTTTASLLAGRFTVSCSFSGPNVTGAGVAVKETDDAVHFLFPASAGDPLHPQVEVSMYDETAASGNFWVFIAAETTVPFTVTVTNVATKKTRTYSAAIRDTAAF